MTQSAVLKTQLQRWKNGAPNFQMYILNFLLMNFGEFQKRDFFIFSPKFTRTWKNAEHFK